MAVSTGIAMKGDQILAFSERNVATWAGLVVEKPAGSYAAGRYKKCINDLQYDLAGIRQPQLAPLHAITLVHAEMGLVYTKWLRLSPK